MRTKRKRAWRVGIASIAMLVGTTAVVLATASPAYAQPGCQDGGVYVVWARGSGQGIGGVEANNFGNSVFTALHAAGTRSYTWAELGNLDGDNHIGSDEYPAVPAIGVFTGDYNTSVFTGVKELITNLNHRYTLGPVGMGCGTETAVLGGFSQGADLIGWMLALTDGNLFGYPIPTLTPEARSHIGSVTLYGDPHFNVACGQNRPWVRANARCNSRPRLGARSPYLPPDFLDRTGSWCDDGDGICAVNDGTVGLGNHTSIYRNLLIQESAAEIALKASVKVCSYIVCPRLAFLDSRGSQFRPNDATPWQFSSSASVSPTAVAVDTQRMGLINSASGALFRRNDTEPWTQIVGPSFQPKAIAVSDSGRMAFIDYRGAWFRTNDNSPWVSMSDASVNPTAVSVSGQRMGLINSVSGALFRLNDNSPWVQIVGPSFHPRKVLVSDTGRMGFIDDRGAWFRPNDNSAWQLISAANAGPTDISVSATRVGLVNAVSGAIFRTSDNGSWITIVGPSFGPMAVAVAG